MDITLYAVPAFVAHVCASACKGDETPTAQNAQKFGETPDSTSLSALH